MTPPARPSRPAASRRWSGLLVAVLWAPLTLADQLPLWEIGVGVSGLNLPQYPGSDQRSGAVVPIPYFVYRGKHLKVSRNLLSARLLRGANLTLEISTGFALPVKSRDNRARTGMPDIDFLGEIGPSLRWDFYRNADTHRKLSLELPLRAVLESDLTYVHDEGWRFNPALRYRHDFRRWRLSTRLSAYFGSRRYHRLLYEVAPRYANAARPVYRANAGYGGIGLSSSLSYHAGDWWIGGFIQLQTVRGATFEDSPLVRQRTDVGAGIAVAWIFDRSQTLVPRWNQ